MHSALHEVQVLVHLCVHKTSEKS